MIGNNIAALPHSPFDGELYDVRVWNCARTASEISSFRYATLQGNEPGLVALCSYLDYFDAFIRCSRRQPGH